MWKSPASFPDISISLTTTAEPTFTGPSNGLSGNFKEWRGARASLSSRMVSTIGSPASLVRFDKNRVPSIVPPEADGDFKKMLRAVAQEGAPVYFVAFNTDVNPGSLSRRAGKFRSPATCSRAAADEIDRRPLRRGDITRPRHINDVVQYYAEVGRSLGHSYTLSFTPARCPRWGIPPDRSPCSR